MRELFSCKLTAREWELYPCKLRVMGRGFNGFTRISRIGSWENILPFSSLRGQNPRNPCESAKSVFNRLLKLRNLHALLFVRLLFQ
ncbi:MAG: hypothetical protein FWG87_08320 [Defluviitaleaceae bacterium]|nr:hypothetical protein [Defluviitaleaceae bacterium]